MRKNYKFKASGLVLIALLAVTCYTSHAAPLGTSIETMEQDLKVSGKVVDENNAPMAGVLVQVDGTTTGAVTDHNGAYVINRVESGSDLIFTFVGYKTVVIAASNQIVNATMEVDALVVEDVVVVGFGSQKKVNLTGSVAVADAEVFESRPVQNAVQALQGVVPGLNVTSNGGELSSTSSINIRGVATIGDGSTGDPLILIDGMEGDLNTINPQDIESISVLKDAAASSIYGSRAPFGVILVTTKKGSAGKMTVNYNNSFRVSSLMNLPNTVDSYSFAHYFNDALTNVGSGVYYTEERIQRISDYMNGVIDTTIIPDSNSPDYWASPYNEGNDNVDWYDVIYKDYSFSQEHTLSLSGGTEKQQVYASANYLDQGGFMNFGEDSYKRYAVNLKTTGEVFKFLKYSYNIKFQRSDYERPTTLTNDANFYGYLAFRGWPTLTLYDNNGYFLMNSGTANGLENGGVSTTRNDRMYQQFSLVATPVKNWNITGELNYRLYHTLDHEDEQVVYDHDVYGNIQSNTSSSYVMEASATSNYMNPNIFTDYSFSIKDSHNFKVMAGFQFESYTNAQFSAERNGIVVPYMSVIDVTSGLNGSNATVSPSVSGYQDDWATAGFFGRFNYDYEGKYLVEINGRYDGTSRFREDKRWNMFPSFSLGWNIAEEDFWEGMKDKVGTLKLRGSYGELGNQNTTNLYPTYQEMNVGSADGYWLLGGLQPNTSSAPSLLNSAMTWETIKTTNIGLDFRVLRNRLSGTFEWFNRKTEDMVGPAPELSNILGTDVPKENNTDLETRGWEFNIKWNDRTSGGFGYSAGIQISDSKTTILDYPNTSYDLSLTSKGGTPGTYYSGQNYGEIYGYTTIGIAKTQAEMDAHLATLNNGGQSALGSQWSAGDIMYKDINGDGKIDYGSLTVGDTGDMTVIGNKTPRYTFGIDLSADYKGFDFRAFFQGVMKRDYMPTSSTFWGVSDAKFKTVGLEEHMDYFRDDPDHALGLNLDSYYPRPLLATSKNYTSQTGYIQDASYIRLKNLQLGYSFDTEMISHLGFSYLRVFVSGENLWTGTSLCSIYDPETIDSGYYGLAYPLQSVISFGFNVNF
ncbi:MAG: TonB-dependent receptor [Rikenellaceae bacterium]